MDTLHFRPNEFRCSCCNVTKHNPHLIAILELVRSHFDKPVFINSSYRCLEHNDEVGGSPKSQHLKGTAADIQVSDVPAVYVYDFLNKVFPNSYGLGNYASFTHIDVRDGRARWNG